MAKSLFKKTFQSSAWSIIDVIFRQGVGFVISIFLARLLLPSDFGTIGMMMIFITISNVFVDSGFASALIRKIDRTENDLSTAFFFNIFVGFCAYIILFAFAPIISSFFNIEELTIYLRVLGLVLIVYSFNIVQNAILISSMRIKQITIISAVSQVSTGVIAIILAYEGWGVWVLVFQQLLASIFQALFLFITTKWLPKLIFDKQSFKYLWGYGSKLLTANLIGTVFNQAYSLVIGKQFGKQELGLYTRSEQFAIQPVNVVNNIINKALVPSLAICQNDLERLRHNYIKCAEIISFIIFPLMFSMSLLAEPIFRVLFGQKWDAAIPLFRVLCLGYSIDIFSYFSLSLIQVMGRTDFTLKLELYKKPVYAFIIAISVIWGLNGIVIGRAAYCVVATMVNLLVVKYLLRYHYLMQIIDIMKYALVSIIILGPSYYLISLICCDYIYQLFLYPLLGGGLYIIICVIFRFRVITYLKQLKNRSD